MICSVLGLCCVGLLGIYHDAVVVFPVGLEMREAGCRLPGSFSFRSDGAELRLIPPLERTKGHFGPGRAGWVVSRVRAVACWAFEGAVTSVEAFRAATRGPVIIGRVSRRAALHAPSLPGTCARIMEAAAAVAFNGFLLLGET